MEHEYSAPNNYVAIAFLAAFKGLRRFVLILCLLGIAAGAVIYVKGQKPIVVNLNPVCDRVWYVTPSQDNPLNKVGPFVRSAQGQLYVHERDGTGYCLLRHEEGWHIRPYESANGTVQAYTQKWWEIPTKYGEVVAPSLPTRNWTPLIAFVVAGFSAMVLFCLWLPSTLVALFSRRLMQNAKESLHE